MTASWQYRDSLSCKANLIGAIGTARDGGIAGLSSQLTARGALDVGSSHWIVVDRYSAKGLPSGRSCARNRTVMTRGWGAVSNSNQEV